MLKSAELSVLESTGEAKVQVRGAVTEDETEDKGCGTHCGTQGNV